MNLPTNLTKVEQIEFRLGKDRYPNLFFGAKLPHAWEIECATSTFTQNIPWTECYNRTISYDGIDYRFNNLGYRSHYDYYAEDLRSKSNILCLGDSDVFGPYKQYNGIWTSLLRTKLPMYNIINMGLPGYSGDTLIRQGVSTIKELSSSIKYVCLIWPLEGRREVVNKSYKKITSVLAPTDVPNEEFWDGIDWVSNNYTYHKNRELINAVCIANNIKFIDLTIVSIGKDLDGERFGKGVFGTDTHVAWSNWFYRKIMNQPSLYEQLRGKK